MKPIVQTELPPGRAANGGRGPKIRRFFWAALTLGLLSNCGRIRESLPDLPFLPESEYVTVEGVRVKRSEIKFREKAMDLLKATRVNQKDAVARLSLGELFQARGEYGLAKGLYIEAKQLDPALPEAHYNLGVIALYEDNFEDALIDLNRALHLSPDDAKIHLRLGMAHAGLAHEKESLASFDQAISLDPELTAAYLEKARFLYKARRFPQAEKVCREALAHLPKNPIRDTAGVRHGLLMEKVLPENWLNPKNAKDQTPDTSAAEAAFDLALCLKAQGKLSEAIQSLPVTGPAHPGFLDLQLLRASLQEGLSDPAGAALTLESLRSARPGSALVIRRLAAVYQKLGRTEEARLARLDSAELDHSDRGLQMEAVRAAQEKKDLPGAIRIYERLVRLDPKDIGSWRALAQGYEQVGIKYRAAEAWQKVVNAEPSDRAARRRLGFLYADLPGSEGKALLQFKEVLEGQPRDPEIHRRMGDLYLKSRNFSEAEKHIRWILEIEPQNAIGHLNLANLYALDKRTEEAVVSFRKAIALRPALPEAHLNLAHVLAGIDRKEEAVAAYSAYLKLKPGDLEARRLMADCLRDLNRRPEAVAEYRTIVAQRAGDASTTMELAKISELLGQKAEAAGMYEGIIERTPANLEALKNAGRLYDELAQPLRAMYCWRRMLKLSPENLYAKKKLAEAHRTIGQDQAARDLFAALGQSGDEEGWRQAAQIDLKAGQNEKAAEALRKVIEIKKNDIPARLLLASLLQPKPDKDSRAEAIRLNQELILLDPKNLAARVNLANLFSNLNRLAEAQDLYLEVLKEKPGHPGALVGQGIIQRKRGEYKEAEASYLKAIEADPKAKWAHFNLALLYRHYLDNPAKAKEYEAKFIECGGRKSPSNEE